MTNRDLARLLARTNGISTGAAADRLDRLVSDILKSLRRGHSADLPGLGKFQPGPVPRFEFEPAIRKPGKRRKTP